MPDLPKKQRITCTVSCHICIYQEFLTGAHQALPEESAAETGLAPRISGSMNAARTCGRNVEPFCENLRRCAAGELLWGLVNRQKGSEP